MGVVVCLQVLGHIPFLSRCSNPNGSLGEGVKLVEVLCVRAQHAGTQIPTPLRSGAVQAAGKKTCEAVPCTRADPVGSQQVKPITGLEVGTGVVGGWFTHTLLGRLGVRWARRTWGRAEEKGAFFWHSMYSSVFHAGQGVPQGGCRLTHAFPWVV